VEEFFRIVVSELILRYGPGVLPWLCLVLIAGTFAYVLTWSLRRQFAQQDLLIMLLREGAQADRDMAVEYRRLVDTIMLGGIGKRR